MNTIERPVTVTIMSAIAIVWGAMGLTIQVIMFLTDKAPGISILLMGLLSMAISTLALIAGFALGLNMLKGFKILTMYIYSAFAFEVLYLVFSLLKDISISWTRLAVAVIIPAAMLFLIEKNGAILQYRKDLAGK